MSKQRQKNDHVRTADPDRRRKARNNAYQHRCRDNKKDIQLLLHAKYWEGECSKQKYELLKGVVETWNRAGCTQCGQWVSSLMSTLERMPATGTADDLHQALKELTIQFDDVYIQQLWVSERGAKKVEGHPKSKLEEVEGRMCEASMKVVIGELKDQITELSVANQQLDEQVKELRQDKIRLYEIIAHLRELRPQGQTSFPRTEGGYACSAPVLTYAPSAMMSVAATAGQGPASSLSHGFQGGTSWGHSTMTAVPMPAATQPAHADCQPSIPPSCF